MPLVTIPGGPASDSYVSIAEADAFFNDRYGYDDWAGLDSDNKARLLRMATDNIDEMSFRGTPLFGRYSRLGQPQARKFPRTLALEMSPRLAAFGVKHIDGAEIAFRAAKADSASTTSSVIVNSLKNRTYFPDDIYKGGSVLITGSAASNRGEIKTILSFDSGTGVFTTEVFSASVADLDIGIVPPVPKTIQKAVCLQAWFIYKEGGSLNARRDLRMQGVVGYSVAENLSETFVGRSSQASGSMTTSSPLCSGAMDFLVQSQWLDSCGVNLQ